MTEPIEKAQEIEQIKEELVNVKEKLGSLNKNPYESEELKDLYSALSKAHLEMLPAKTDKDQPYFKTRYADLSSVVKASRPSLAKHGLSVIQRVLSNGDNRLFLYTRLAHSSGQWMESRMAILPPKPDIQTLGSYITYLRRYSYASMVGVVTSDEDDDGEKAMESARKSGISGKEPTKISKAQLEVISSELKGYEEILENILKGFKISKLSDLPSHHYTKCIERIREIRRAKED